MSQPMFTTIDGVYQDGQVKLSKLPETISTHTQVLVTFLEPGNFNSEQIRSLIERLETIAGIQQGLDELNSGHVRSISDFAQEMQQRYDISS